MMHGLLKDMGRALVTRESPHEPGERSRLWKSEDALQVMRNRLGTTNVRAIFIPNATLQTECLASMPNLQLLWLDGTNIEGDFSELPSELRWLRWKSCPLECIPSEWSLEHVAVLDLSKTESSSPSSTKQLWKGNSHDKKPKYLKVLQLNWCEYLEKLPDLSIPTPLLTLNLENCSELNTLPDSLGFLVQLECLNLSGCFNLEELPDNICNLLSLKKLYLRDCSSIGRLPDALGRLRSLAELDIWSLIGIQGLTSFEGLRSLEKLNLSKCRRLKSLPASIGELKNLKHLEMNECFSVSSLPEEFGNLVSLESLFMNFCLKLRKLPETFGDLENLRVLEMKNTPYLSDLPHSFSRLRSHLVRYGTDCTVLDGIHQIGDMLSLEVIEVENGSFGTLPLNFGKLTQLTTLILNNCKNLSELCGLPADLVKVDICDCPQLRRIYGMSDLEKLKSLVLFECEQLDMLPQFSSRQSLTELNISGCKNVKSFEGVEGLKSLQKLYLSGCSVSVLHLSQWLKELSVYTNEVPQCLEHIVQVENMSSEEDLLWWSSTNINSKYAGVVFCFLVKKCHEDTIRMSIVTDRGQVCDTIQIFRNKQTIGGNELYMYIYRENHPAFRTLRVADSLSVRARGCSKYLKECGMQVLYNNDEDAVFKRLGRDLDLLVQNYSENACSTQSVLDMETARKQLRLTC
eukprot:Gb_14266 [translate_table: standard]